MKKSMIVAIGLIGSLFFNKIGAMHHLSNAFIFDASKTHSITIKSFDNKGFGFPSRAIGKGKKKLYIGEEKAAFYAIDSTPMSNRVCLTYEKGYLVYYTLDTKMPIDKLTFKDIKNKNARKHVMLGTGATATTQASTTFVVDVVGGNEISIKLILTQNLPVPNLGTDVANMSMPLGMYEPPVK